MSSSAGNRFAARDDFCVFTLGVADITPIGMFCLLNPASCLAFTLYASGFLPFDSRRAFRSSAGNAHSTID